MKKMNVITFAETGHVLGVVTRASQPEKAVTVEQVAAGGFTLRDSAANNIIVTVPEDEIGVVLVNTDTRILYQPHLFVMENDKPEQKPQLPAAPVPPNFELDGNQITVRLPVPVHSSTDVWCQISGNGLAESIVRSVTVPGTAASPTNTGTETLTLGVGNYYVVMLAPGYALSVFREPVL